MRATVVVEADPVADGARRMLDAVEALAMNALLLQRPDNALDEPRRVCRQQLNRPVVPLLALAGRASLRLKRDGVACRCPA